MNVGFGPKGIRSFRSSWPSLQSLEVSFSFILHVFIPDSIRCVLNEPNAHCQSDTSGPFCDNYLCECARHRLNEAINKHSFKVSFHCV